MNYTTSRDYEKLWDLVQEGKEIVCFLEGLSTYVTIARKNGEYSDVLSAGVLGVAARTKIDFINQCENIHLEFLPPDAWIKIESDKDLPPEDIAVFACIDEDCRVIGKKLKMNFVTAATTYTLDRITHWKPLPEAPEVGDVPTFYPITTEELKAAQKVERKSHQVPEWAHIAKFGNNKGLK